MHIKCNIHDDERGYLAVTDHGNIAVTDEGGYARLLHWPIGRQRLVIQHPDYDFHDAEVWADGEKLEKKGAALFLDIRDADIDLRITGVKRNE
ncbi:hypothetical protein [Allorhodopirellula solitaria]|uniref:Uncharacterized protein n=1 Tax=Allorhodopirellula solitaria TaxID=2527987 RepID=A0A5C5XW38_9BACT|nr:hypothetical protein [Allorhodopirellula solitaria]TWT66603.1 hypothetical protein CA85_27000 [Allorhodopirellula solitaria]